MAFGNAAIPSLIYSYGGKAPTEGGEIVAEQISRGHRYWNRLVEIERGRRTAVDAALVECFPRLAEIETQIAAIEAEIEDLREAIRRENAKERKRTGTVADRGQIQRLVERLRPLRAERKAERTRAFGPDSLSAARKELTAASKAKPQDIQRLHRAEQNLAAEIEAWKTSVPEASRLETLLSEIDARAGETARAARKDSGLYWGTYLAIEAGLKRSGPPPQFHRWTGSGQVAVQIQNGLSVADAFSGESTLLRIEPLPDGIHDGPHGRSATRTMVWLRVGSAGRDPVWAKFVINLHRPLPEDALIKWVYLHRRRVAQHDHWQLSVVLSRLAGWAKSDTADSGRVGIDVGWRRVPEGLRVAYWCGDDGEEGSLVIPAAQIARWRLPEMQRSERDLAYDSMLAETREWLKNRELPDVVQEAAANIAQWRGHGRLARLIQVLIESGTLDEADPLRARLIAWDRADRRQWRDEAHTRRAYERYRDDLYRVFAADLRRRYRMLAIEKVNWSQLRRKAKAESEAEDGAVREYVNAASCGRLQGVISETASSVDWRGAAETTARCSDCGELTGEPDRAALYHTCRECGVTLDQDRNAALNLLRASGEVSAGEPTSTRG